MNTRWQSLKDSFKEFENEEYYKLLEETMKELESSNICTKANGMNGLAGLLQTKSETYPRDVCWEGFCLWMSKPHQGRMSRMIRAVERENQTLQEECIHEDKEKKHQLKKSKLNLEQQKFQFGKSSIQKSLEIDNKKVKTAQSGIDAGVNLAEKVEQQFKKNK